MFTTRDVLNTNNANDTNIFLNTDLARILNTSYFEHEIRRRPTDRREVIERTTRIFFGTHIAPITRILVRDGTLTWGLLNENDTNEINTDSTRSFVNTHCLRLVLEVESLYFQLSESMLSLYSIIEKAPDLQCCSFFV